MSVKIISAISSNGLIGKNGELVVKNKLDMQSFKEKTTGATVIMGRKTFESMGSKTLKNRTNIVISSSIIESTGVITRTSLKEAIEETNEKNIKDKYRRIHGYSNNIWLIGGASIYEEGMEYADEIHLTVSKTKVEFTKEDTIARFPVINPMIWRAPTMSVFYIPGYDKGDEFSRTDQDIALYTYKRSNT